MYKKSVTILLITMATIYALCIHVNRSVGSRNLPEIVLTTEEMQTLDSGSFGDVAIKLNHTWGNARMVRTVIFKGDGLVLIHEWQDAAQLKEDVLSGNIDRSLFTDAEYQMVLKEHVDYNIYERAEISPSVMLEILSIVSDNLNGMYEQGPTAGDFYTDTIVLDIMTPDNGLIIAETVDFEGSNADRLSILYDVESLIETELENVETEDLDALEYTKLSEEIIPDWSDEVWKAQRNLEN